VGSGSCGFYCQNRPDPFPGSEMTCYVSSGTFNSTHSLTLVEVASGNCVFLFEWTDPSPGRMS